MAYALTKEFIEKLVNQPILDFEIKAGSNEGDNVQGELKAIRAESATGEIINLVHKTMAPDPIARMFIVENQTFRIENTFYSRIAPAIENLIKSRNPADYKLPIPKLYASFNNDNDDYTTMEDLRPLGYRMADKYEGLSLPETSLFMKELGRFHAFTYFFLKHEGEQFFDTVDSGIKKSKWHEPEKQEESDLMFKAVVDYMVDIISKKNPELGSKVAAKLKGENARDIVMRTGNLTDSKYFPLLIHGDIWVNNMMFKYDQDGNPVSVQFLDFQMTRRGNIFEELEYFFFTSTTPEFRKNHLLECLGIYYDTFESTLNGIQCPTPAGFTRGFLIDSFNDGMLAAYLYMGFAISMQLGEKPSIPKMDAFMDNSGAPYVVHTKEQNGGSSSDQKEAPSGGGRPPAFNFADIPIHVRVAGFMAGLRAQLEASPRAVQRLLDITEEMIERSVL